MCKEFSGESLFKELLVVLQAKLNFVFGVFRILHQKSEFQLNLKYRITEVPAWGGFNLLIGHIYAKIQNNYMFDAVSLLYLAKKPLSSQGKLAQNKEIFGKPSHRTFEALALEFLLLSITAHWLEFHCCPSALFPGADLDKILSEFLMKD